MSAHPESRPAAGSVQVFEPAPFAGAALDLRSLPTQANAMRHYRLQLIAPDDLGTAVLAVEPGEVIVVEVEATSLSDGVLLQARANVTCRGECVRCLSELEYPLSIELGEMFFAPEAVERMRAEQGDEAVEDIEVLEGDCINLEPLIRDALVSQLPYAPACSVDCEGLCDGCGQPLRDLPDDHSHQQIDPRFAALASLLGNQDGEAAADL